MTEEEWGSLVKRLERKAEANPKRYARKVLLFGLLGYAVLGLALVLLAGLAVGIGYLALNSSLLLGKAIIPLAGLAWVILGALKIRFDPPEGFSVSRSEAPALFEMIEDVGRRVRGPSVHHVLVDGNFNASVVQIPRALGLLGQRNYLVLGLPYMQATSPDEFRAIVAHELGHLSRNHGRVSSWIYRIHATWHSLLTALEERRRLGTALFRRFFLWYQPRFEAYSFPLRRLHEYDADKAAADAAGAEPAATSLVAAVLNASYLDTEYWPRVYARANEEPLPPPGVFRALPEGLAEARKHPRADTWIANALARPTAPHDTHPSIGARIERLGFQPQEIARTARAARNGSNAADAYLGAAASAVADHIDTEWRSAVRRQWAERHRQVEEERERLVELEEQAKTAELSPEEAAERCVLMEDVSGAEAALRLWEELLLRQSDDAPTAFAVGRLRLAQGDSTGLKLLEHAMETADEAILPACEIAFNFLMEQGRSDEAEAYERRAVARMQELAAAGEERSTVSVDDELVPADLPADAVERIRSALSSWDEVGRVYLVRKEVHHLADELPLYIIGVLPRKPWRTLWRDEEEGQRTLAERIVEKLDLPFEFSVIELGPRSKLCKRFESLPDAEILRR